MAGNNPIQRQDIEKLDEILNEKECILFGGASLPFYGISRATKDVDVELLNTNAEQVLNLADQGYDTRLIQDYLGHKSIQNTVRYTTTNANRFKGLWK